MRINAVHFIRFIRTFKTLTPRLDFIMYKIKILLWVCFILVAVALMYMSYKTRKDVIHAVTLSKARQLNASLFSEEPDSYKQQVEVKKEQEICSQTQRKEWLYKRCEVYRKSGAILKNRTVKVLVDHKHRVVYCPVQKAGSSSWKTILANITSQGSVKPNMTLKQIRVLHSNIEKYGLRKRVYNDSLSNYTKLMIVRNPLDRLVSAYRDKMRGGDVSFNRYASTIVTKYRENKTNTDMFPTFEEFVRMMFSHDAFSYNPHWDRYFFKCNPCEVNYDYILKIETMEQDMNMFLSQVYNIHKEGLGKTRLNSFRDTSSEDRNTFSQHLEIYRQLSAEQVQRINSFFENERLFFGYFFDEKTFDANCCYPLQARSSDQCCC